MSEESPKRPYFRPSTASQRQKMFKVWEETGSVKRACEAARLSRGTFYYWLPRFKKEGYKGLEETRSHTPHNTRRTKEEIEKQVVEMKEAHPDFGYQRIADELMKKNQWEPVVSASTVRYILKRREWEGKPEQVEVKKKEEVAIRHAEKPGQTVNVDIGFVPISHKAVEEIPAVSGSSGKLKVSKTKSEKQENGWPGQVFSKTESTYEQAMDAYIDARAQKDSSDKKTKPEQGSIKARKEELLEQEKSLHQERRSIREKRKKEDETCRQLKKQRRKEKAALKKLTRQQRRAKRGERKAKEQVWAQKRDARREQKQRRKEEDRIWREKRNQIQLDLYNLPIGAFVAILVIIDNCTRLCLGLPIFVAGKHVTAQMVVDALAALLPPHLQYLIADRGVHFKAKVLLELAHFREFKRVLLSPHRPQSNGIAERFVQTLKSLLTAYSWKNPEELQPIISALQSEYNDRPHQGVELKGLSPNEYARQLNQSLSLVG